MSKFLTWLRKNSNLIVLGIIVLIGLAMRWPSVNLIKCDYLDDCGRDLLVAKHMAEGKTSLRASPISALDAAKSSPQYFVLLAAWYRLGGLTAISYFNLLMGLGVIILSYAIVVAITKDYVLGWVVALLVSFLPMFIKASVMMWQPHWEYFFAGLSLWLCLKAWQNKTKYWHILAAISFFPLLHQSYVALPFGAILSVFLSFSWWQLFKHKTQSTWWHKLLLFLVLGLIWGSLVIVMGFFNFSVLQSSLQQFDQNQIFTLHQFWRKISLIPETLVFSLMDPRVYDWFWKIIMFLMILATGYGLWKAKSHTEKIQIGLLLSLFLSVVAGIIDPGDGIEDWHLFLQRYVFVLLLVLVPYLLQFKRLWLYFFELGLVVVLLIQNQFSIRELLTHQHYAFVNSTAVARLIHADVQAQGLSFSQFRLAVSRSEIPHWMVIDIAGRPDRLIKNLDFLASTYETAGIQLSLELLDPGYMQRVKVVPATEFWSNYLQPNSDVFYVICQENLSRGVSACPTDLWLPNATKESETFLGQVWLGQRDLGFVHRLTFHRSPTSSQSAEFSLQ